eukprot:TRINITY_DN1126_c0_g1_i2.p1 TRINITY_DN1126_c0_g1~~TRINITY_DN1126_c0_g1_i2.p1  ORF type:complete len:1789 (-),score=296.61 TRINITY_DN1126_c0_g1_i2:70-5436(-)
MEGLSETIVVLKVGQRVTVSDKLGIGTVRYVGPVWFSPLTDWIGIELDNYADHKKHNGTVGNIAYFTCPVGHGIFARANTLSLVELQPTVTATQLAPADVAKGNGKPSTDEGDIGKFESSSLEHLLADGAPSPVLDVITHELLRDPVILASSGHTISLASFRNNNNVDPWTKTPNPTVIPNVGKAQEVDTYIEEKLKARLQAAMSSGKEDGLLGVARLLAPVVRVTLDRPDSSAALNFQRAVGNVFLDTSTPLLSAVTPEQQARLLLSPQAQECLVRCLWQQSEKNCDTMLKLLRTTGGCLLFPTDRSVLQRALGVGLKKLLKDDQNKAFALALLHHIGRTLPSKESTELTLDDIIKKLGEKTHGARVAKAVEDGLIFTVEDLQSMSEEDLKEMKWPPATRNAVRKFFAAHAGSSDNQSKQVDEFDELSDDEKYEDAPVVVPVPVLAPASDPKKSVVQPDLTTTAQPAATSTIPGAVYVCNIPNGITQQEVERVFSAYGAIVSIAAAGKGPILKDGKYYIAMFVNFADEACAQRAAGSTNGANHWGSVLTSNFRQAKPGETRSSSSLVNSLPVPHQVALSRVQACWLLGVGISPLQRQHPHVQFPIDNDQHTIVLSGANPTVLAAAIADLDASLRSINIHQRVLSEDQVAHVLSKTKQVKSVLSKFSVAFDCDKDEGVIRLIGNDETKIAAANKALESEFGRCQVKTKVDLTIEQAVFIQNRRDEDIEKMRKQLGATSVTYPVTERQAGYGMCFATPTSKPRKQQQRHFDKADRGEGGRRGTGGEAADNQGRRGGKPRYPGKGDSNNSNNNKAPHKRPDASSPPPHVKKNNTHYSGGGRERGPKQRVDKPEKHRAGPAGQQRVHGPAVSTNRQKPPQMMPIVIMGVRRAVDGLQEYIMTMQQHIVSESRKVTIPKDTWGIIRKNVATMSKKLIAERDVTVEFWRKGNDLKLRACGVDKSEVDIAIEALVGASSTVCEQMPLTALEFKTLSKALYDTKKAEFEKEWKVALWFNKNTTDDTSSAVSDKCSGISVTGDSAETVEAAKCALRALIDNRVLKTKQIKVDDPALLALFAASAAAMKREIIAQAKEHSTFVTFRSTGTKLVIDLKGTSAQLVAAEASINKWLNNRKAETVQQPASLDRTAFQLLTRNGYNLAHTVERKNSVRIVWPRTNQTSAGVSVPNRTLIERMMPNGVTIRVSLGDILKDSADILVNPANNLLQHMGGLALYIAEKAGPEFIAESTRWVQANGPIKTGSVATTSAGNLKQFKQVVHAVGPMWKGLPGEDKLLQATTTGILAEVLRTQAASVTIPAISTGIFGGDSKRCANILIGTTLATVRNMPSGTTLRLVTFSMNDKLKATDFAEMLKMLTAEAHDNDDDVKQDKMWQWAWQEDNKSFHNYDPDQNQQIEDAYQKYLAEGNARSQLVALKIVGDVLGVQNGAQYNVSFADMKQRNAKSGFARQLRREQVAILRPPKALPYQKSQPDLEVETDELSCPVSKEVIICGLPANVIQATHYINALIAKYVKTIQMSLDQPLTQTSQATLEKLATSQGVKLTTDNPKSITLIGLAENLAQARADILEELIKSTDRVRYPADWTAMNGSIALIPLAANSSEWQAVTNRIAETLTVKTIVRIERVQNKPLWERYYREHARVAKKNGKPNELELFHGTRESDPKLIYASEDGFDMRHSRTGMWGTGSYFAANASYSNGYSSQEAASGARQFFLARAVCGDSYKMPSNSALRMPPNKPASASGVQEKYDSVTGETGGSVVFILYHNCMAYPYYLITYTA